MRATRRQLPALRHSAIFAPAVPFGGAVPEPAAWAMMLVGFGTVGAGLRSRIRQSVRFTRA